MLGFEKPQSSENEVQDATTLLRQALLFPGSPLAGRVTLLYLKVGSARKLLTVRVTEITRQVFYP